MPQRILIADDDPRIRLIVRQITVGLASAIYEASDGAEAIEICAAENPDWVVMDLHMSLVDGLRALLEIKARLPETRVVIVSQDDDAGLRAKALRAGAWAFVLKENLHVLPAILTEVPVQVLQVPPRPLPETSNVKFPRKPS